MNRLHPATMVVAFLPKLYDAFRQVLPFIALSFFSGKGDRSELFIAAIGILGGFGAISAYLTTRYGIEESTLVYRSGWLFKRDRRIPFDKIQNLNVRQGLLERLFKVVTLEVETAAGSGAEMKLQVVTEGAAELLRKELSIQMATPTATTVPSDDAIYRLSRQDLLFGAMTENQGGVVIFGIFGTIGGAALVQVISQIEHIWQYVPGWLAWAGAVAIIGAVWFAGWVYGGFQYWLKYGGFTVRAEQGMYRISHGILTKFQYTVRLHRVEIATVSSSVWQRLVGRCAVHVGTAGTFGESGTMAPVAMMVPVSDSRDVLRRVLPDFDESTLEWKPYPGYYLWVAIFRSLIGLSVLGCLVAFVFWATRHTRTFHMASEWQVGVAVLAVLWSVLSNCLNFRKMAYAISPAYIGTRSGFFRKSTQFMPVSRIDAVGTTEPAWWRKRGVTKAVANAMVHRIGFGMLLESDADRLWRLVVNRPVEISHSNLDLSPDPVA
jgi:putative membrane protein